MSALSSGLGAVGDLTKIGFGTALGFGLAGPEGSRGTNISNSIFDAIENTAGMTKYDLIGMAGNMMLEDNSFMMKKFPKLNKLYSGPQDALGFIDMADPYNYNQVPSRGDMSAQAKQLFAAVEGGRRTALDDIFKQTYGDTPPEGCLGTYPDKCPNLVQQWCDLDKAKLTDIKANTNNYVWCIAKNDIIKKSECTAGPTSPITPEQVQKWGTDADARCKLLQDNKDNLVWCNDKQAVTLASRCSGETRPINCPVPKDTKIQSCKQYKALETQFAQDIPRYYTIKNFRAADFDADGCTFIDPANFKEEITGPDGTNPLIPYQFMLNKGDCPSEYMTYYQDYYVKNHPDTQVLDCNFYDGYMNMKVYNDSGYQTVEFTNDLALATTECSYDDKDGKYYKNKYRIVKQFPQNGGKECPEGTADDGTLAERELCPSEDCTFKPSTTNTDDQGWYFKTSSGTKKPGWSNCFQADYCNTFHDTTPLTATEKITYLTKCTNPTDCSQSTDPNCTEYPEECSPLQYRLKNNALSATDQTYYTTNCQTGPVISESYNSLTRERTVVRGPIGDQCKLMDFQAKNHDKITLNEEDNFYYTLFSCNQTKADGSYDDEQWYQYRQRDVDKPAKYGGQCDNYQVRNQYNSDSECKPKDCVYKPWSEPGECGLYDKETMDRYNLPEGWYSLQTRDVLTQGDYGGTECSDQDIEYVKFTTCPAKNCVLEENWNTTECYIDSSDGMYKRMKYKSVLQDAENGGTCEGPQLVIEPCDQQPQECKVSPTWSSWSNCDLAEDGYTYVRYRKKDLLQIPSAGQQCSDLIEREVCSPQNCQVGAWKDWGSCVSDGSGSYKQTRTRSITQQPAYGGNSCPLTSETRPCQPSTFSNVLTTFTNLFSSTPTSSPTPTISINTTSSSPDSSLNYQQISQQGTKASSSSQLPSSATNQPPPSSMLNDLGKAFRSLF